MFSVTSCCKSLRQLCPVTTMKQVIVVAVSCYNNETSHRGCVFCYDNETSHRGCCFLLRQWNNLNKSSWLLFPVTTMEQLEQVVVVAVTTLQQVIVVAVSCYNNTSHRDCFLLEHSNKSSWLLFSVQQYNFLLQQYKKSSWRRVLSCAGIIAQTIRSTSHENNIQRYQNIS